MKTWSKQYADSMSFSETSKFTGNLTPACLGHTENTIQDKTSSDAVRRVKSEGLEPLSGCTAACILVRFTFSSCLYHQCPQ